MKNALWFVLVLAVIGGGVWFALKPAVRAKFPFGGGGGQPEDTGSDAGRDKSLAPKGTANE